MPTLADVFRDLNALKAEAVVKEYALGGATAVLFYAEPSRTYDVDVFVLLPPTQSGILSLDRIYQWAHERSAPAQSEHIIMHGVPVQFLPAHNALAEDGVRTARTLDYAGVPVRVMSPEHLMALALQVGGPRQRERAWQLLESGHVNRPALRRLLAAHNIEVEIDDGAEG